MAVAEVLVEMEGVEEGEPEVGAEAEGACL